MILSFVFLRLRARARVRRSGFQARRPQLFPPLLAVVFFPLFCPTSSPACSARPASGVVKYNALPQPNPLTGAGRQSVRRPAPGDLAPAVADFFRDGKFDSSSFPLCNGAAARCHCPCTVIIVGSDAVGSRLRLRHCQVPLPLDRRQR